MSVSDDLLKAADIMEDRGQTTGTAFDPDGKVCALGAIGFATVPHFEGYLNYVSVLRRDPRAARAVNALAAYLNPSDPRSTDTVWRFNDSYRGRRGKKKVVNAFREAAAQIQKAELARITELCSQVCPVSFPLPKVDVTPNPVDRRTVDSLDRQHRTPEAMPVTPRLTALVGAT